MELADLHPPLGLRLRCGDLELRGLADGDLLALGALAERGVHAPGEMPFYVPWTDAPPGLLARNVAQYHWRLRALFGPDAWGLELGVWRAGELLGVQGLAASRFRVTGTAETGSWLGREHQGRGVGTLMRQMVCVLAFDHLGAAEVTSGAFLDNPASLAVSRKVGYAEGGVRRLERRPGELALNRQLVLTPGDLVRPDEPVEVEGLARVRAALGLDSAPSR